MNWVFRDAQLKIEWAEKHIFDLQAIFDKFIDTEYYSVVVKNNADTGHNALEFINTKPIPAAIPLIIGDAIHNTRTALDLVVSQIELEKTGSNTKWCKFPFGETRDELIGTVRGGAIQKFSPALADFIINVVKPYRVGNDTLCALHDLDIIDKHKIIIPTMAVTSVRVDVQDDKGPIYSGKFIRRVSFNGEISDYPATVTSPHNLQIKNYGQDTFDIFFEIGVPKTRKPVIPTLHNFVEIVTDIIDSIETIIKP